MKRISAALLLAIGCAKETPKADSATVGASTTAVATPDPSRALDTTPKSGSQPVAAREPVQREQVTPIQAAQGNRALVGKLAEHGFDPVTFLAITPAGGTQTRVSGPHLEALRAVRGTEIWARGEMDRTAFRVDTFEVRRANDQAVADGIVSVAGTTVTVRTSNGTLTYPDAPSELRAAAGARVWITQPIRGQAPSFGVIRAAAR